MGVRAAPRGRVDPGGARDVEFPDEHIPTIFNALEVDFAGEAAAEHSRVADDLVTGQGSPNGHERLVLEVQQELGNSWVRTVATVAMRFLCFLSPLPRRGLRKVCSGLIRGTPLPSIPVTTIGPLCLGSRTWCCW